MRKLFPAIYFFLSLILISSCGFRGTSTIQFSVKIDSAENINTDSVSSVVKGQLSRAFGFDRNNIKCTNNSGEIFSFEIADVKKDSSLLNEIRELLSSSCEIEIWETFENSDIIARMNAANDSLWKRADKNMFLDKKTGAITDSVKYFRAKYQIFSILAPAYDSKNNKMEAGAILGRCRNRDTSELLNFFKQDAVKNNFPRNLKFVFGPSAFDTEILNLYALKTNRSDFGPALKVGRVVSAKKELSDKSDFYKIIFKMNKRNAKDWEFLTMNNIDKPLAFTMNGKIKAVPIVRGKITGGNSMLTGNFTSQQADRIIHHLKAGKLPFNMKVVSIEFAPDK